MDWWFLLAFAAGAATTRWLPGAVLYLHRRAWRLWWRWISRGGGGRPRMSREIVELIVRMSAENPLWGAPRIHGELLKLGFHVSQSTVSRYMLPRGSGRGWSRFLRSHAQAIVGVDMLAVPTLSFQRLYAFVVLGHARRRILHVEVTDRPGALWLAHQVGEAFGSDALGIFLVRDNDGAYGLAFRRRLRAMGIRDRPTRPHSPWQNGHVERLIGSTRRECLDHLVIVSAGHLRRVLAAYVRYYNEDRTHLALAKDAPCGRAIERDGGIVSRPVLGGLHRRYWRKPGRVGY